MSFLNASLPIQKFMLEWTRGKPEELMMAILSARQYNSSITETDLQVMDGKKRSLKINYYPPVCSDTGTGSENICDAGTVLEPSQEFFTLSQLTASNVYQLNKEDIRLTDDGYSFSEHAKMQIASVIPTVRRKLSTAMANLMVANVGLLPNGNTSQVLDMSDLSNGQVNPVGLWTIEKAYWDSGYSNPFIVGGTSVFNWKKAVDIGGVNDRGQDISQMGRTNAYYDNLVNTAFNDANNEHVISFDPQMLKFIAFNQNAGMFATDEMSIDQLDGLFTKGMDGSINGVWTDPMTGIIWDLDINYDKCNKRWTFQIFLNWDIFFMPPQVCNIQGVNGIFHWKTCLPQNVTCEGDSPITPVSASTFKYDTSGNITFPAYIATLGIGGQNTQPAQEVADIAALAVLFNDSYNGVTFTVSGTELRYSGYSGIEFTINEGLGSEVTGTFAV